MTDEDREEVERIAGELRFTDWAILFFFLCMCFTTCTLAARITALEKKLQTLKAKP